MNFKLILNAVFLILSLIIASFAQDKTDFAVGDTIYVNAYYAGCVKATVKQIEPKYYVHIDEGSYKGTDTYYRAERLGECPQKADNTKADNTPDKQTDQTPNEDNLTVGNRVDVFLSGNQEGKNRGTIVEVSGNQIKVRYDGCGDKKDVWENAMLIRPAAAISAEATEIKFFVGRWSMTTAGISSAAIVWGQAAGIQINADGSYIWFQDAGKSPVKGKWSPHAKIEGTRFGTEAQNGIIIKDARGAEWKMYRRKSTSDTADHITIEMMCQGLTQIGTRN